MRKVKTLRMLKKQLLHIINQTQKSTYKQMGMHIPVMLSTLTLLAAYPLDKQVDKYVKSLPTNSILRCVDTALHGLIAALVWVTACVISSRRGYDLHLFQVNTQAREQDCEHGSDRGSNCAQIDYSFHCMKSGLWPLKVLEVCTAFIIGGPVIDADHFIKARSLNIENAILYPGRGFLHWTSLTITLSGLVIITGLIMTSNICICVGVQIFICTFSHQIRDATHRGLSFYPLPSTPTCPYYLYILCTILMPYPVAFLFTYMRQKEDSQHHPIIVM